MMVADTIPVKRRSKVNQLEQKAAAKQFVERWQAAEGSETSEANKFWIELVGDVLGIPNPTHALDFERKVRGKWIDVLYEDMGILIENKSRGVDLDKAYERGKNDGGDARIVTPYQQAKWYADNMPRSQSPRWIITCNFDEIRIYDLDKEDPQRSMESLRLEELPDLVHRLSFFTRKENSRLEREKQLSIEAGTVVGKLYDRLSTRYHDIESDEEEQRSLNILITRIVFLLYAEDSGLLQEKDAFYNYLKGFSVEGMAGALKDLFTVLKTPEEERGRLYVPDKAKEFPYINGGLFADEIIIPPLDDNTRTTLLLEASAKFDWRSISPTIFGAVFESTLNPETRRQGGMHYTSVENIHKVTGPLFYDALRKELAEIEGEKQQKKREFRLRKFREKLSKIKVLDPACGSGNFLTETYLGLRKLENRVLEDLYGDQMVFAGFDPILVSIDQFYGIEINDFAVEVAKTALWIAELQMLEQTREITGEWIEALPLKKNDNIWCENALRIDWNDVLQANECSYIIGNPPFYGAMEMTRAQKEEMKVVFDNLKGVGELDYVCAWYAKAAEYIGEKPIACAFVSTNSICQGLPVGVFWQYAKQQCGLDIDFAFRTFIWNNEAVDQAHVHCVIVGFSKNGFLKRQKKLFLEDGTVVNAQNIDGYLVDEPDVFISERSKPVSDVPQMAFGSMPRTKGFTITAEQKRQFVSKNPLSAKWIKPFMGATEFLNDKPRYCLWLLDADDNEIEQCPLVVERIEQVRQERSASKAESTRKMAETPKEFAQIAQPVSGNYLLVPRHSSQRRRYLPMGFFGVDVICGDSNLLVPNATVYEFGIMSSGFHNAWMRRVCGRIKSDYRYSKDIVYNNFVWPDPTPEQRARIEACAQAILDARDNHPGKSLADLYDPDKMPVDLLAAHKALDKAVEDAYGVEFDGDEEKIVAHLFKLYAEKTKENRK